MFVEAGFRATIFTQLSLHAKFNLLSRGQWEQESRRFYFRIAYTSLLLSIDGKDEPEDALRMSNEISTKKQSFYVTGMREYASVLRAVAEKVPTGMLSTGARVLDPSDFKAWLFALAEKAEGA